MAKGVIHLKWWKRMIPLSIIISIGLMFISPLFAIMFFIGYLAGEPILSADLDQVGLTNTEGNWMRKFGIFGVLFVMFWMPYAFIFPHRSFLSHFPIVSDLVRIAYLLLIPAILWWYYQMPISNTMLLGLGGVVAGLSLSTTIHYILDK